MLQIKMTVHSASRGQVPVVARDAENNPVPAFAAGIVVELVAADGSGKAQMLREYVPDVAAALGLFEVGAEIVVTYAAAPAV